MQAVESETLILYHTDLRGQWPEPAAQALAARLPYARRLAARAGGATQRASLAGIALALRALTRILGRRVSAGELVFAQGQKPRLVQHTGGAAAIGAGAPDTVGGAEPTAPPDFSISHAGPWVGCAALARGQVGFDVEPDSAPRSADWVVREALLKATGAGIGAVREVGALEVDDGCMYWRGERWHVQRLGLFTGACACVVSSVAVRELRAQGLALAELFDP
ncbi:MAG TPA: hypothetical protein VGP32_02960 [Steroidobacteraceae bacterium]|jgi:hypothetical protein|nr:hypothetical protein [Steroidobacteraceae bacterium]